MRRRAGVTLIEVLISATILSLVFTAVISFYVEAVAVSTKRDEQSARLRRFHIGLDKMEQILREGRVVDLRVRSILFLKMAEGAEQDGFPLYEPEAAQFASTEKGVILTANGEEKLILPTQEGEHVIFYWIPESPPDGVSKTALNIALYSSGMGKRSDLFFHRTINVQNY
jgi:prepilin-type N-terminal cleavage/methylation domain-containing protein